MRTRCGEADVWAAERRRVVLVELVLQDRGAQSRSVSRGEVEARGGALAVVGRSGTSDLLLSRSLFLRSPRLHVCERQQRSRYREAARHIGDYRAQQDEEGSEGGTNRGEEDRGRHLHHACARSTESVKRRGGRGGSGREREGEEDAPALRRLLARICSCTAASTVRIWVVSACTSRSAEARRARRRGGKEGGKREGGE